MNADVEDDEEERKERNQGINKQIEEMAEKY